MLWLLLLLLVLVLVLFFLLEKVAVGLEVERQQLEHECNSTQDDAITEESRYHFLLHLFSVTEARLERVRQEER